MKDEIEKLAIDILEIPSTPQLDSIIVYWHNVAVGKGYVTILCWGSAWTAYFGAMGGETIQQFFSGADTGYLVTKLGITRWLKQSKAHESYLAKVVNAVKAELQTKADELRGKR